MAVTWNIVGLDATKTVGSLSDVVTIIHWNVSDEDSGHRGYTCGSVGRAAADSDSFTAYADITKDNAIAWAKAALGTDKVSEIEANVATQIQNSKTPTKTFGVPW